MHRKLSQIQRKIINLMNISEWSNKRRCISNEEYLYEHKIPFIYLNASRLAISGKIICIDGIYEQYVISVHDILNKIKLKKYLKNEITRRKIRKNNNNIMIVLYQWYILPKVINNKIINYL